MPQGVEPD